MSDVSEMPVKIILMALLFHMLQTLLHALSVCFPPFVANGTKGLFSFTSILYFVCVHPPNNPILSINSNRWTRKIESFICIEKTNPIFPISHVLKVTKTKNKRLTVND